MQMFKRFYRDPMLTIANHTYILTGVLIASWLTAAGLFSWFETGANYYDGLYWSMTTMSTVGYGDYSPHSDAGKVLAMAFQAWSTFFLVPCVVANIIDRLRQDRDKWTNEEQEHLLSRIEAIATKLECE
jgi:voltage-gated potassium channel